jgi:hypothetical protein
MHSIVEKDCFQLHWICRYFLLRTIFWMYIPSNLFLSILYTIVRKMKKHIIYPVIYCSSYHNVLFSIVTYIQLLDIYFFGYMRKRILRKHPQICGEKAREGFMNNDKGSSPLDSSPLASNFVRISTHWFPSQINNSPIFCQKFTNSRKKLT